MTAFCALCGNTNPADLGQVIGICLDAGECHQRQIQRYARKITDLEDLLASIWLYVNWRFVTRQLTTEQKVLWADAVDWSNDRNHDGIGDPSVVERWWRD